MTSRSRRAASSFSRTSCSTGTLSLKTTTDSPACSASIASKKAYGPGTDTSASVAGPRPPPTRWCGPAPGPWHRRPGGGGGAQRRVERRERRGERCLVVGPDPDQQVVRPGAVRAVRPRPASSSRLRSVAMATSAAVTPGEERTACVTCISVTESL
jgi:hypothetical protein